MSEAKEILKNNRIEKLPLIDDNRNIHGLFSTQDILNTENYPNASAALMKKCNLNLQIQDVRDLIRALTLVVQSNTQSIVANLELIRNIQTKLQDLSDVVQELKNIRNYLKKDLNIGINLFN